MIDRLQGVSNGSPFLGVEKLDLKRPIFPIRLETPFSVIVRLRRLQTGFADGLEQPVVRRGIHLLCLPSRDLCPQRPAESFVPFQKSTAHPCNTA